jgi:hypothetical protein
VIKKIFIFAVLLLTAVFSSCEDGVVGDDGLPGIWIDEANADTLLIEDDSNFYHSNVNMFYDHYDYRVEGDSMLIGYSGKMMILVLASKHYFELKGDELMIDFSGKGCFGFPNERMNYKRVPKPKLE